MYGVRLRELEVELVLKDQKGGLRLGDQQVTLELIKT